MKGWDESEVSYVEIPQATTCLWDSSRDSKMENRFETEVEVGTPGGRYIQPKVKEE